MFKKIILLLYIVVCSYSCTRSSFATRNESYTPAKEVKPIELKEQNPTIELKKKKITSIAKMEKIETFDKKDLKEISDFTLNEKKHVSISTSFNPFETNNTLVIKLDDLKKSFRYPCEGILLSNYGARSGRFHSGVDIKSAIGDNIYTILPGVVRLSRLYGAYGYVIVVRHANGLESVYSHNKKNLVNVGDIVKAGEVIAHSGRSGNATTSHLHFEVRIKGKTINPNLLINTSTRSLQSGNLIATYRNHGVVATNSKQARSVKREVTKKESPKKVESKGGKKGVHIVKRGDSLYSIARRNGTTVDKLCRANNIKKSSILRLGQKIKIE